MAHVVPLPELDPVVAQDVVRGDEVEVEVRERPLAQEPQDRTPFGPREIETRQLLRLLLPDGENKLLSLLETKATEQQ